MTWYLMQTKPRQEKLAEENLLRQGFGCYLPTCRVERVKAGRLSACDEALFPGYVFVAVEEGKSTSPLRSTLGCRGVVRFGQRLADVPESLVESIRVRAEVSPIHARFETGQSVRVVEGGLAGVEGIFCSMVGEDRVVILLRILQQSQKVLVPLSAVV
jgi:transcriptional antiterminator RfaH